MEQNEFDVGYTFQYSVVVTDEKVRQFAEVSGDHNPIHLDDEYAKKTRFGQRIAHGMIVGGFISKALIEGFKRGVYLSQTLKFKNPVFINDRITVTLTVAAVRKSRGLGTIETVVTKDNGDVVVKGEAVVLFEGAIEAE